MSLDRQDRIDRHIRGEMPEDELQAFERDMEKDESLSYQYEETFLIAESVRDVAADRELMEALWMTSKEEMEALMREKRSGRRFLIRAAWVAAAVLLVAVVTRVWQLPPSKSMDGLYLVYYEPARYEALVARGGDSGESDKLSREAFVEYKKGNYIAASRGFESVPAKTDEVSFFSAICYLELNDPENAITRLLPLVEMGDRCLYFQPAEWYLSMAYLKSHQKENALSTLRKIVEADGFYAEKAREVLDKLDIGHTNESMSN